MNNQPQDNTTRNYGKAPILPTTCPHCGHGPLVLGPAPFVVRERTLPADNFYPEMDMVVIGYQLSDGDFYTCAWQPAEMEDEWTREQALADSQACADWWNSQVELALAS